MIDSLVVHDRLGGIVQPVVPSLDTQWNLLPPSPLTAIPGAWLGRDFRRRGAALSPFHQNSLERNEIRPETSRTLADRGAVFGDAKRARISLFIPKVPNQAGERADI